MRFNYRTLKNITIKASLAALFLSLSFEPLFAFSLTGDGHYSLKGTFSGKPTYESTGLNEMIEHNLRLNIEARASDKISAHVEFRLLGDLRQSFLGDQGVSRSCASGNEASCNEVLNPIDNSYVPYLPNIRKAYVRVALPFCILDAGRREVEWGMGLMYDAGNDLFDNYSSTFDGVKCDINLQKFQTLGFSLSYDKLQESNLSTSDSSRLNDITGTGNREDDINRFGFSIIVDDTKRKNNTGISTKIGGNVGFIKGKQFDTNINIIDLYSQLNVYKFTWENEFIIRWGDSANPSLRYYGGFAPIDGAGAITGANEGSKTNSIGFAGKFSYSLSESGTLSGPKEFRIGSYQSHKMFLEYAYAPGNAEGYKNPQNRDKKSSAMAFHQNYKPALILFNGPETGDHLNIDGIYDNDRLMNAALFGVGYEWNSFKYGRLEAKAIGGFMLEDLPDDLRSTATAATPKIGYGGKDFGYELDLKYNYALNKNVSLGVNAAGILLGDAFKKYEDNDIDYSYLFETTLSVKL